MKLQSDSCPIYGPSGNYLYINITTVRNTMQSVNSPIYEYMSAPGNISKLEPHTATCRQHTVVRPCMVGTEPSMHYISILLSQRIIPICQSGINLGRNRHSAIFERRTNHCFRTIVAWWQFHMSWNKICYLSTEKVILLFFHKLMI